MLYLFVILFPPICISLPHKNMSESEIYSFHVNDTKTFCKNKSFVCKVNGSRVCTMRNIDNETEYKDFDSWCDLFVHNLCEYPDNEFAIVEAKSCSKYLKSRRQGTNATEADVETTTVDTTTVDVDINSTDEYGNGTTKAALREYVPLYPEDQSYDGHYCPLSCPDVYDPTCMNVNKGAGKYFKFYTFVNHCYGDLYYCKHSEEFDLPESAEVSLNIGMQSGLSWSYCGAYRYIQFTRFSEVTSAMGHYGWLHGDQRYTKILEPYERKPGYG